MCDQDEFDITIGKLDYILSLLLIWSKPGMMSSKSANWQTLQHHAEDMIGVGNKILERYLQKD